jgi:mevalonate kinase
VIASAPGKLILSGEYAVLGGAPAVVVAVDRRAIAHHGTGQPSAFLDAVAHELGKDHLDIAVDSAAFYDGTTKLGLGSSAAVTVAATALALGTADRERVLAVASAAHAAAQGARGARGSGADVAAAIHGGCIVYSHARIEPITWPSELALLPFFTGIAADTATLVAQVTASRTPATHDALAMIADASERIVAGIREHRSVLLVADFALAAHAIDQLARATRVELVPACVTAARYALARFGGTAKTTGAGGGDVAVGIVPASADVSAARAALIEAGCRPLQLAVDTTGVDTRPGEE